jgi:hypothetical protein
MRMGKDKEIQNIGEEIRMEEISNYVKV